MSAIPLTDQMMLVGIIADTWEDAVHLGGELLVQAGLVTPRYVEMMVHNLKTLGPYVIIAPGVALPHARPEHGVISPGISLVQFAQPVSFASNPEAQVTVMICLAATDSSSHLSYLQTIAEIISDDQKLHVLKTASDKKEIGKLFQKDW